MPPPTITTSRSSATVIPRRSCRVRGPTAQPRCGRAAQWRPAAARRGGRRGPSRRRLRRGRPTHRRRRPNAVDAEFVGRPDRRRDAGLPHLVEHCADRCWVGQGERGTGLEGPRQKASELSLADPGEAASLPASCGAAGAPPDPAHRRRMDAVGLFERRRARLRLRSADDRALAGCVAQHLEQRPCVPADGLLDAAGCE